MNEKYVVNMKRKRCALLIHTTYITFCNSVPRICLSLFLINSGRWIVTHLYIDDSYKHGRWLDELVYEWSRRNKMRAHIATEQHCLLDAPQKWRLHYQRTGILND